MFPFYYFPLVYFVTITFTLDKKVVFFFFTGSLRYLNANVIVFLLQVDGSDSRNIHACPSAANVFDLPKQTEGP